MIEGWCEVLGCPYCRGALRPAEGGQLACSLCGQSFLVRGQVPIMLRQEEKARFVELNRQYREARLRERWRPLTEQQLLTLPFGSPPGYPALYWAVRRQSYRRLRRWLVEEGPSPGGGPVADLGAGVGWLSYRLAQDGYRVLALEASLDETFGLDAARPYFAAGTAFLPVQGNLEYPPLQNESLALIIYNASLHYARDLPGTLQRAAQSLRPGGRLIILDTPIAPEPRPGSGRGDRHLGRQELGQALLDTGLRPRWISVRRGAAWWLYGAKKWLKGEVQFSFPMVVAEGT